jgi:hypothetical protein
MKMNLKNISIFSLTLCLSVSSCIDESENLVNGKGKDLVRIIAEPDASGFNRTSAGFEAKPTTGTTFLEIRRDPTSAASSNKALTVDFQIDNTIVTNYNAWVDDYNEYVDWWNLDLDHDNDGIEETEEMEYETQMKALEAPRYHLPATSVTFAPGELVKYIPMDLDPTGAGTTLGSMDFTAKYALGVKFTNTGDYTAKTAGDNVLVQVNVKNAWDGMYSAKGVFHHPTGGDREIDRNKYLQTTGANTVVTELGDLGPQGYQMILTINQDNTVTVTPAGATPNVDQHWGPNFYDPIKKQFHLHYSYNTSAPRIVEETLTFK